MSELPAKTPDASGASRGSIVEPLENGKVASAPSNAAAGNGGAPSAKDFGGNPSGRKSKFAFPAGTPQGDEERRAADRDRKRRNRDEAARVAEPPVLPAAAPGALGDVPAKAGGQVPDVLAPGDSSAPVIPWTPELLAEFTTEIVNACEASRQNSLSELAKEGGLPEKVVRKIFDDAKYPAASKRTMQLAAPKVTAKLLNKTGVSAEHADIIAFVGAAILIWKDGRSLKSDVLELIEKNNAAQNAPPATIAAQL